MTTTAIRFRPQMRLAPLLVVIFAVSVAIYPAWTVDDAYITLRYARNLVEHGALTWNVGDPNVEGYTGILWPLLAAGAIWAHLDPLLILKGVSLISTGAMLYLADRILIELRAGTDQRHMALLLLVASPWAIHARSGLETMPFTALLLVGVLLYLRRSAYLPLCCLLAALVRPEGAAFALALGAADCARAPRNVLRWIGLAWLPGGGYFLWRAGYYGALLPNTFYAKAAAGQSSWDHVAAWASSGVLLPGLAWRMSRPDLDRLRLVRGLVVALAAFVGILVLLYGQSELLMDYGYRFFAPITPLIVVGLTASWGRARVSPLIVAHVLGCVVATVGNGIWAWNYTRMAEGEHVPAAAWLAVHAQAGDTLMVVVDAGIVPYLTQLRTIDVGALNDPYLAREHNPHARVDYLMGQNPAWVLLSDGSLGIVAGEETRAALLADPRWRSGYELAATFNGPQSFQYHQEVWKRRDGL